MGALPPVFIEFLGSATGFLATSGKVKTEMAALEKSNAGTMAKMSGVSKAALLGIGVAASVAAVKTIHMAADFETAMTRVRTGAGESAENMGLVSRGVLKMAGEVGKSTEELTASLYTVESAGYHGADGLEVLRVAAMGAKVGAAELPPVADAMTTALNAYNLTAKDSTAVMNALIATEANGKTNLEALAGSMSGILPVSAAAKVGMNEVLGAMATMTAQGSDARVAATYLRQTIGQLSNPSAKAAQEMRGLGLDATKVAQKLGKDGLAATLEMLTNAISAKMGPAGTVIVETLRKASSSTTEYEKALANLKPAEQTQIGALATMVGGTKSMMGALMLTGPHMDTFKGNVQKINEQVKAGGHHIEGWADVQKTLNQKISEAKGNIEGLAISIGMDLMPYAQKFMEWLVTASGFLAKNKIALELFAVGLVAVAIGMAAASIASWSFTDSLLANPITWIVVGIVLLVAALVVLVIKWRVVWTFIKDISKTVVDWLVSAWHWLADQTSQIWQSQIVNPLKTAWHAISAFFTAAWHWVADPLVAAWNWISRTTVAVWNWISAFFMKWWPLLLLIFATPIFTLISLWNHCHKAIADAAVAVWNWISGMLGAVWDWIVGKAQSAWAFVAKWIIDPTAQMWSYVVSAWNTLMGWLGAAWDWVAGKANGAWQLVKTYVINPTQQLWDKIVEIFGKINSWIWGALQSVVDTAKDFMSKFKSVGSAIVDGIIDGITGSWHWLTDKVSNLADSALKAAKSALGVNSPSKVFADTIGRAIPEGIAVGIDKHAAKATDAVRKLAGGTVGDFGSVGALEPAFAGGSASFRTGGPVRYETHVHVTVQGTVTADRDLADTIKRVMLQDAARNSSSYTPFRR